MSLPITPHTLAAAYEFLRTCPPHRAWLLPDADAVAFHVVRDKTLFGYFQRAKGHHIGVSEAGVGHTDTLLRVMAHEMIHLWQDIRRSETPKTHHNAQFRVAARRTCRVHGWDAKSFYF